MDTLNLFGNEGPVELLGGGASAVYIRDFLATEVAWRLLADLNAAIEWHQPRIRMFGRASPLPREVAWVADPGVAYRYSGVSSVPQGWTPFLRDLRGRLEEHTGALFNSVLINRYRDGADTVAWHADDEPELGLTPTITSISLGAERRFQLRHKATKHTVEIRLEHGSLLVMSGTCQRDWVHQVPREAKVKESRVNLTFRYVFPKHETAADPD